ncbi:MAG TPA: DUF2380 domain-containing protein [Steroidobacteraceae bacterium]
MQQIVNERTGARIKGIRAGLMPGVIAALTAVAVLAAVAVLLLGDASPALAAPAPASPPVKIAVFDFELEDASPAASLPEERAQTATSMEQVSSEARRVMAQSGRYRLVDVSHVDAMPVKDKALRNCDGCENAIALKLGADQAMVGVVRQVTLTDYYVLIQISDARTGKILDRQSAAFSGGADGWASGVRMVIRHGILGAVAGARTG